MGRRKLKQLKTVSIKANFPPRVCTRKYETPTPEGLIKIDEFLKQGAQCDITIKVGEKRISAHREILIKSIPYFEAMLQFREIASANNSREIAVPDVDPKALESIIEFVYTGEVAVNDDNVQALTLCADFMQLNEVRDICAEYLILSLNPENVIGIRQLAKLISCNEVVVEADLLLHSKFVEVAVSSMEFVGIDISELVDILMSDNLNVSTEEEVFEAAMRWIQHDQESRAEFLPRLLETVRYTILSPEFKELQLQNDDLLKNCLEAHDMLLNVKIFHEPRKHVFVGKIYILKQCGRPNNVPHTVIYYPRKEEFRKAMPMPTKDDLISATAYGGKLYTFGGISEDQYSNAVKVYDPKTDGWSTLAPMLVTRWFLGVAAIIDRIYVCGGWNRKESFKNVEFYCPKTNSWTAASPMLENRDNFALVALGGFLYAVGGCNKSSKFTEKYNPRLDEWTMAPPMLNGRHGPGVTTLDGKLYAAGGYDMGDTNTFEVYDPELETWTLLAPMLKKRNRFSLIANMGKLFAMGGEQENTIEVYDPETNEWSLNGILPMMDSCLVAVAI